MTQFALQSAAVDNFCANVNTALVGYLLSQPKLWQQIVRVAHNKDSYSHWCRAICLIYTTLIPTSFIVRKPDASWIKILQQFKAACTPCEPDYFL